MTQPIIFPDPISSLTQISGAILLYFDEPLIMGVPAAVIPTVGEQSFKVLELVHRRNPPWAAALYFVLEQAREQALGTISVLDRLAKVRGAALKTVYFSYPAGDKPFSAAREAATQLDGRLASASSYITPATAASDLERHIFLEAFLENGSDTGALYEYCERLFTSNGLEHLLLSAYLLRATALNGVTTALGVLLTNPRVAELLAAAVPERPDAAPTQVTDVIAWEIFRQVISRRLDPLTDDRIELIGEIRNARDPERTAFVDRCRDIASTLVEQRSAMGADELRRYVESRVEPQIAALLKLEKKAVRAVIDELFSDKLTWGALSGLISGLAAGSAILSATGAVAALSSIGAAAYKARVKTQSTIKESDLRLLYFIDRRT